MTDTHPSKSEIQVRLKNLEEENKLLLSHLFRVQEELEFYFLQCKNFEKRRGALSGNLGDGFFTYEKMSEVLAEVDRLSILLETQSQIHNIQIKNNLNARLGDLLIQGVSQNRICAEVLIKMFRIWRESKNQIDPTLANHIVDKVIAAYHEQGIKGVKKMLATISAPSRRAKVFTALARHLMQIGVFDEAATYARLAYEEEPKPYRLKWLAFRLYDSGNILEAEACLSLLPEDIPFSDSELKQRECVYREAYRARVRDKKN